MPKKKMITIEEGDLRSMLAAVGSTAWLAGAEGKPVNEVTMITERVFHEHLTHSAFDANRTINEHDRKKAEKSKPGIFIVALALAPCSAYKLYMTATARFVDDPALAKAWEPEMAESMLTGVKDGRFIGPQIKPPPGYRLAVEDVK